MSPFVVLGVSGTYFNIFVIWIELMEANSVDPDHMSLSVASEPGPSCSKQR